MKVHSSQCNSRNGEKRSADFESEVFSASVNRGWLLAVNVKFDDSLATGIGDIKVAATVLCHPVWMCESVIQADAIDSMAELSFRRETLNAIVQAADPNLVVSIYKYTDRAEGVL